MSYIGNEPIVSATRTITEVVATAGQTTFTANGGYTVGFIDVFVNGAQLQTSDFTATNGSTITLNSAATIGDDIRLVAWGKFTVANSYTQSAADDTFVRRDSSLVNKIINGCMRVDQRNSGASITPATGTYTLDRWLVYQSTASKFSLQQNAGSVTPPTGFASYLGITSLSAYSISATDYYILQQPIEGYNTSDLAFGTANAKNVTLSFWVYSSLTGTFGGVVNNGAGNRTYPFSYTVSSANTWTQVSVTIPGDTTGTWYTNNSIGLTVRFGLGVGSTYTAPAGSWTSSANIFSCNGATSVVGTSGATFYITGVDLRKGSYSTAPTFDMRQYGQELQLCQRYCWNFNSALGGTGYSRFSISANSSTTGSQAVIPFPVQMRAAPSLTTPSAGQFGIYSATLTFTVTGIVLDQYSSQAAEINFSVASGLTNGYSGQIMTLNNTTAYLLFSAEL